MTEVQIYAGTLTASENERSATGLLVPFDEECSSNLGRFTVGSDSFTVPADLTGVGLHVDHEREKVVGAVSSLTKTDKGLVGMFSFADTPEGNAALDDARSGRKSKLSVEVADVILKAGKAVGGRIFGASLVKAGAFPSATLLAAAADTEELPAPPAPGAEPVETSNTVTDEITDQDGVTHTRTTTTVTKAETDADGNTTTTITTTEVIEEPGAPAPTEPNQEAAVLPNTLTASKAPAATTESRLPSIATIAESIAALKADPTNHQAQTLLAELSDITISGTGALPAAGVLRENWVGQLDQGETYSRQYITLGQLGTDINAAGKKGYKVHRGTSAAPVNSYASTGEWGGNKTPIGSGTGWTETAASVLSRFAFGNDVAREFYDLPGGTEVIEAFLALVVEDHAVWSDEKALTAWNVAAGAPIAASTYPTDYPATLGKVLQGILAVKAKKADKRRDKPTFAIVNDKAYEELIYTPFEKIPEYIKFAVNTDGEGTADGDLQIVVGDIGIVDTPAVIVGARKAIQFDELAGGPLHIDALELAKGGIDKALHGYLQTFVVRPEAVKLIGVGDTRSNTTAYSAGRVIKASAVTYRVVAAGTTGSGAPTAPAVGETVADGTATLLRLS